MVRFSFLAVATILISSCQSPTQAPPAFVAQHTVVADLFEAARNGDHKLVESLLTPGSARQISLLFVPPLPSGSTNGIQEFSKILSTLPEPDCRYVGSQEGVDVDCRGLLSEFGLKAYPGPQGALQLDLTMDAQTFSSLTESPPALPADAPR